METMVRGSRKPDLGITIADAAAEADFSVLTVADVQVIGEMGGEIVFNSGATALIVATDGKSAMVTYAWQATDVDLLGRMWITVMVDWGTGVPQTFPSDGPLRLDFVRAAGD